MSSPKAKGAAPPPEHAVVEESSIGLSGAGRPAFAAAFVKALGGPTGDVVQDVTCSFQRQLGRLYVSTNGIFFYSNLFGFERRIRINYDQILAVTTIRTTSLLVKTLEAEEYVFRSFDNREFLLETILRYHSNAEPENGAATTTLDDGNKREARDKSLEDTDNDISVGGEQLLPALDPTGNDARVHISRNDRIMDTRFHVVDDEVMDNNADAQWVKLLQLSSQWESAIVGLNLACKSVRAFFDSFLRDDAANSLNVFLSDVIGDSNIVMNTWRKDSAPGVTKSISRTLHYEHKSGLIMAKVARQQTYLTYGDNRSCLKNVTSVSGIKGVPGDAFFLEDSWFIESSSENGVILNVKFHVNFTKPTMLRSIIKNRTTTEAREWYIQYTSFLRQKIHPSGLQDDAILPPNSAKTNATAVEILKSVGRQFMSGASDFYLPVILLVGLALIIFRLQLRVSVLENSVKELETMLYELKKSQLA